MSNCVYMFVLVHVHVHVHVCFIWTQATRHCQGNTGDTIRVWGLLLSSRSIKANEGRRQKSVSQLSFILQRDVESKQDRSLSVLERARTIEND